MPDKGGAGSRGKRRNVDPADVVRQQKGAAVNLFAAHRQLYSGDPAFYLFAIFTRRNPVARAFLSGIGRIAGVELTWFASRKAPR